MKLVVQRVSHASVTVEGNTIGSIGRGLLVFVGVGKEDTRETADRCVKKLLGLRIFPDENGKTNRSLSQVNGELLLVSQFTLYADLSHGNRPAFVNAGAPEPAQELYDYMIAECRKQVPIVEQGQFGAHMKVCSENDGPFTIVMEL